MKLAAVPSQILTNFHSMVGGVVMGLIIMLAIKVVQDIFLRLSVWVQDKFRRLSAWVQDKFRRLSVWVQDIPALAERRILNKLPSPISAIILVLLIVVVYVVYNVTVWLAPKLRIVVCYLLPSVFIVMFLYNLGHHN